MLTSRSVRPTGDSTASLPGSAGIADRRSQVAHSMTATGFDPHTLLADSRLGVLATIKSDGLPQLSPVTPFYDRDADVIYVSMTEGRAKTANLRRDPRAAIEVTSPDGWAWATAEGPVTLTGPGTDPHGPEVEALVDYYRSAAGEHPDWDEYRSVMVSDRRVLMAMTVDAGLRREDPLTRDLGGDAVEQRRDSGWPRGDCRACRC